MVNRISLILAVLFFCIGLQAQNILTDVYRDEVSIYILLPVSQLYFSDETSTADYQISLNLLDEDRQTVYQSIRKLSLNKDTLAKTSIPFIQITHKIKPGKYTLISMLQNPKLGDKAESQYELLLSDKKPIRILNTIIAENDEVAFFPTGYDELNHALKNCTLLLDTDIECDSILIKAQVNDSISFFPIPKNSGNKFDLMPILNTGPVNWLELIYYADNIMESNDWLFFQTGFKYQTLYTLSEQLLQIKYIAKQNEWKTIRKMAQKNEESAIKYFWEKHSNTPDNKKNEFQDIFYARVLKADDLFTVHKKLPGWKSDRGRIFIIKGPPDDIAEETFPIGYKPYIIWRYFHDNTVYRFVDKSGYGNYTLEEEYSEF